MFIHESTAAVAGAVAVAVDVTRAKCCNIKIVHIAKSFACQVTRGFNSGFPSDTLLNFRHKYTIIKTIIAIAHKIATRNMLPVLEGHRLQIPSSS
mmetsp:Transcript_25052/g.40238  ORF Transcript_25052/g.40238 Transcript_25052/m.40238 type:complete len:95 (+) Transcript_25052:1556-1840(+)